MIQEYALDPSVLVAKFTDHYGFLRAVFNDTGRVLSQYPRKWRQKVMQELGAAPENDRVRLVELLSRWLLPHSVAREHSVFNGGDWLTEAEEEDGRLPFHGILADSNPRRHGRVIPFGDIVTGDHPLWDCSRSCRVTRAARDIVAAVAPMLLRSKRIVLIDPFFLIEPRFYDVLTEIVRVITSEQSVHPVEEIQVCTALKGRRATAPDAAERRNLARQFKWECEDGLPGVVPAGFKVNITVYFEKKNRSDAHDRHILTDIAGVDFGRGLDRRQEEEDMKPVRINLVDYDECCRLEEDFQPHMSGVSASYHVESEFTVIGEG